MNRSSLAAGLLVGLASSASVAAAGGTATDQAVSLTYSPIHWGSQPETHLTGVDATGDQIYQTGMWYRADGDTREFPMPAPDSETYAGGEIVAVWNNVDGKGFRVEEHTWVFDSEGPSGGFITYIRAKNANATPRQLTLFHYLDVTLAGTSANDSGALVTPRFLKFSDGASRVAYRASGASHYQVGPYPVLLNLLSDATATNLDDTGLPFGPGDAAMAFQYGPATLPAGYWFPFSLVSAFFNPASDRVKGDYHGTGGPPGLYGQASNLGGRYYQWMRRTLQHSMRSPFGAPSGNSSLVGVDDFDGDFVDDAVDRDMVTGTAYVWGSVITGAPTLPLNWKLSATGDFDGNGKADILWRNTTSQKLVIWTMSGNAKVGNIIPNPDQAVDGNWEVAAAADFDGDGQRDLLWYNQTSGKVVLWYMDASVVRIAGLFTNPSSVGNNNWRVRAVGDFGKGPGGVYDTQDIVWQNDTSKKIVVWHMDHGATRTGGVFITPETLLGAYDLVGPR